MKKVLFSIFCCLAPSLFFAQQTEDAVIEFTASVDTNAPSVSLTWSVQANTTELLLIRRERGALNWFLLLDTIGQVPTAMTDEFVDMGKTYEYAMVQVADVVTSFGYLSVPIETPLVESRGSILIFVEEALQVPLSMELDRLEQDLVGDGWKVVWHPVGTDATVESVKSQIVADYMANPDQVNSVFLFGEIPVPYSGNTAWDGHTDHQGAWAADTYYADIDGTWEDVSVNNTTPSRAANDNVPGDGKFDHSFTPSALELAVGRVDFSNLNEMTFGTSRTELLRRYLDKNHNWRNHLYTAQHQALVDDNFGYFGGEAFAANGYRNFYPLVGVNNVVDGDFFDSTDDQSFLFGYGCGGGTYTSANGVGNSAQFASDSVNIVFSMLFGSYHGDWDSESNPFMMSALASKGGILSCSWAGRPHWFYHPFAAGETLGSCALETQNTCDNPGYFGSFGNCGVHVTLLGDPSLRAHMVAPVSDLVANARCSAVELSWAASAAPDIIGYYVYRSDALNGDFERLTMTPVSGLSFTDSNPLTGTNYYQVRTIVMQETESGFYENASTGRMVNLDFQEGTPPSLQSSGAILSCVSPSTDLSAMSDATQPDFSWTSPNGMLINGQTIQVTIPGVYTVTVTDLATDCTNTITTEVTLDDDLPSASPVASAEIDCVNSEVQLFANPTTNDLMFQWDGPNGFSTNEENPLVSEPGAYELTITADNGCSLVLSVTVNENTALPEIDIAPTNGLNCSQIDVMLSASASVTGANYSAIWSTISGLIISGENTLTPIVAACGIYTLTVINNLTGCSAEASIEVTCDFEIPDLIVEGDTHIPCFGLETELQAITTTMGGQIEWIGQPEPSNPTQSLPAGEYTVVVISQNGCTSSESVEVTEEPEIVISSISSIDCNGVSSISPIVAGGVPPYSIVVNPDGPIPPATTYEITVVDANDCSVTMSGVTPDPDILSLELSHTDETISGLNDGTATALPSSGLPPYSYNWSNGATTQTVTDLAPGIYMVTITDGGGCEVTGEVVILGGIVATEETEGVLGLEISPNPSSGKISIALSLDASDQAVLSIVDLAGRQLLQKTSNISTGHFWQLDLRDQAAGIYFCKIMINDKVVIRKFILE